MSPTSKVIMLPPGMSRPDESEDNMVYLLDTELRKILERMFITA